MMKELNTSFNKFTRLGAFIVFALSLFIACSEEVEDPIPTEEEWSIAMSELTEWVRTVPFRNEGVEYDSTDVDFFVTNDYWFFTIIGSHQDTASVYQPYLGQLSKEHLIYRFTSPIVKLHDKEIQNYRRLKKNDSLFSLVGENGFWLNEDTLLSIWNYAIHHTFYGDFTEDYGFESIVIDELRKDD